MCTSARFFSWEISYTLYNSSYSNLASDVLLRIFNLYFPDLRLKLIPETQSVRFLPSTKFAFHSLSWKFVPRRPADLALRSFNFSHSLVSCNFPSPSSPSPLQPARIVISFVKNMILLRPRVKSEHNCLNKSTISGYSNFPINKVLIRPLSWDVQILFSRFLVDNLTFWFSHISPFWYWSHVLCFWAFQYKPPPAVLLN